MPTTAGWRRSTRRTRRCPPPTTQSVLEDCPCTAPHRVRGLACTIEYCRAVCGSVCGSACVVLMTILSSFLFSSLYGNAATDAKRGDEAKGMRVPRRSTTLFILSTSPDTPDHHAVHSLYVSHHAGAPLCALSLRLSPSAAPCRLTVWCTPWCYIPVPTRALRVLVQFIGRYDLETPLLYDVAASRNQCISP